MLSYKQEIEQFETADFEVCPAWYVGEGDPEGFGLVLFPEGIVLIFDDDDGGGYFDAEYAVELADAIGNRGLTQVGPDITVTRDAETVLHFTEPGLTVDWPVAERYIEEFREALCEVSAESAKRQTAV